jgi:hypothetical protein
VRKICSRVAVPPVLRAGTPTMGTRKEAEMSMFTRRTPAVGNGKAGVEWAMWCDDVMAIEAVGDDLEADPSGGESAEAGPLFIHGGRGEVSPTRSMVKLSTHYLGEVSSPRRRRRGTKRAMTGGDRPSRRRQVDRRRPGCTRVGDGRRRIGDPTRLESIDSTNKRFVGDAPRTQAIIDGEHG